MSDAPDPHGGVVAGADPDGPPVSVHSVINQTNARNA